MKAFRIHRIQIKRGKPLRRSDGGKPLIADHGHVHRLKQLQRHIGLNNCIWLMILEYVAPQPCKPGFLVVSRSDRRFQLLFRHYVSRF